MCCLYSVGDELFSDTFKVKEVADILYEVEGKVRNVHVVNHVSFELAL